MARKRLSDLLREEGEKPEDKQPASEGKTSGSKANQSQGDQQTAKDQASEEQAIPVAAEVIAAQADQVGDFVSELRDAAAESDGSHANSIEADITTDLENIITALKADLEAAQQSLQDKEAALQTEVARLQAKITAQETAIQELQSEVEKSEQLKTELDAAKQTILQLTQTNAKSTGRSPVLPSTRAAEPEFEPNRTQPVAPAVRPAPAERPKLHQLELRKMLDHPTQPGSLPPMSSEKLGSLPPMSSEKRVEKEEVKLSDADVGWMD